MPTAVQVRQATALRVAGATTGLVESRWGYDGILDESRSPVHLSYAVGVPSVEYPDGIGGTRKRAPLPVRCVADLRVVLQYQLVAHHEVEAADAARDVETAIRNRLLVVDETWPKTFSLVARGVEQSQPAPGWVQVEATYSAEYYDSTS